MRSPGEPLGWVPWSQKTFVHSLIRSFTHSCFIHWTGMPLQIPRTCNSIVTSYLCPALHKGPIPARSLAEPELQRSLAKSARHGFLCRAFPSSL